MDTVVIDGSAVSQSKRSCKRGDIGSAFGLGRESSSVVDVGEVAQSRQYVNAVASLIRSNRDESKRV